MQNTILTINEVHNGIPIFQLPLLNDFQREKNETILPNISKNFINSAINISSSRLPKQLKEHLFKFLMNNTTKNNQIMLPQNNIQMRNNSQNSHVSLRKLFTKEEDEKIKKLVKIFGTRHWDLISQFIDGRTAKQCRDRYSNYLIPDYFQGEWSFEEDSLLIKLFNENGAKWSTIQKSFPNRSANSIKNRWHYFLRRKNNSKKNLKINKESKSSNSIDEKHENQVELINEIENENNDDDIFDQNENDDIFGLFNNMENENSWMVFN